MRNLSHIPLDGLLNLRDLGGIATQDGQITQYHRFLRSELPTVLTPEMADYFESVNLKLVIDLRRPHEIEAQVCALEGVGSWEYRNISILESIDNEYLRTLVPSHGAAYPLGHIYSLGLDQPHHNLKPLCEALAEVEEGAVLFHCAHGKDRTGTLAAMLLLNAGVADDDIVANYSVSADYLWPIIKPLLDNLDPEYQPFFRSDAENMRIYLQAFHERFASVEEYMATFGVSAETAQRLRRRLLD